MSLEGGTQDYSPSYAIGGVCPSCSARVRSLELDGYCARCAGAPSAPLPSRADELRRQVRTFEVAAAKTPHNFNRRRYLARADLLSAELAELEAGERG